jgi:cysteinyl-tRNA synthetase
MTPSEEDTPMKPTMIVLAALLLVSLACNIGVSPPTEGDQVPEDTPIVEQPPEDTPTVEQSPEDTPTVEQPPESSPTEEVISPLTEPAASFKDISHWLYLIDVNLGSRTVEQITQSRYDMVVIDFITSESNNTDYPLQEVIEEWHQADHPKLVLAYIDIGQAEDFRTYWESGWGIGDPEWIAGGDPDGWEGNYPVAYWWDEWREIWLGDSGYIQDILDAGFDGVYLDWVEAYSDENVIDLAEQDGVDPTEEMIWWVTDIADFGREQNPDFLVIGQNAAELVAYDDYASVIDAVAQEQVWFDGGADNEPPGDCPLPRTEEDVETQAYQDSLSPECLDTYFAYPDSTLHVSSEEYLEQLALAQDKGLVIFTVDYALEQENIDWVYRTSRELGFIPFVSNRMLDRFLEPVP